MENKINWKFHFIYGIIISWVIIIVIATTKSAGDTTLANNIAFAAAIASILLALVAIIITISGNTSINQNLRDLTVASTELKKVPDSISNSIQMLDERIDLIKEPMETVKKETGETKMMMSELSNKLFDKSKIRIDPKNKIINGSNKEAIDLFIENAIHNGLKVREVTLFIIFIYSLENKKEILITEYYTKHFNSELYGKLFSMYCNGYIECLLKSNIINATLNYSASTSILNSISVTEVNNKLITYIRKLIAENNTNYDVEVIKTLKSL